MVKKTTKKEAVQYFEGTGRRKSSVARVRIFPENKQKQFLINKVEKDEYFKTQELRDRAIAPIVATDGKLGYYITAHVYGGGQSGQADAVKLGLSRALVKFNLDFQKVLRDLDYLKRDPRKKERKKAGLKKARRSPQWSKR